MGGLLNMVSARSVLIYGPHSGGRLRVTHYKYVVIRFFSRWGWMDLCGLLLLSYRIYFLCHYFEVDHNYIAGGIWFLSENVLIDN